jgi:hypothetical protein
MLGRRQSSHKNRTRIAYHEAGHAVVGVVLRGAIREVSIGPDNDLSREVRHPRSRADYWSAEEIAGGRSPAGKRDLVLLNTRESRMTPAESRSGRIRSPCGMRWQIVITTVLRAPVSPIDSSPLFKQTKNPASA